jgi:hypothetical protein
MAGLFPMTRPCFSEPTAPEIIAAFDVMQIAKWIATAKSVIQSIHCCDGKMTAIINTPVANPEMISKNR